MKPEIQVPEDYLYPEQYWGYEQAFAQGVIFKFHVERGDYWDYKHEQWSKQFGVGQDNKVTFKCQVHSANSHGTNQFIYVTFHDNHAYIGLNVRPYGSGELPTPKELKG